MRVLQVGSNSVHVSNFLVAMNKLGLNQDLLSEEQLNFDGVENNFVCSFRSSNPLNWIQSFRKLGNLLKNKRPDCIHVHQATRLAFFVTLQAKRQNIPVVLTAWGSDVLLVPQKNFLFHYLVKKTLERSKVITADSMSMIEAMKQLVPDKRYEWIQYGIDAIPTVKKEKIIFSNRLHTPLYRIDKVIRYFSEFLEKEPEWKLVIGGSGTDTELLKQLAIDLNCSESVEFVGWLTASDNQFWYARATIYISIPSSDGTSVSVLEAMSAGCIPVLPDLPVTHEWITEEQGVIESSGRNPLLDAVKLDLNACQASNMDRIARIALRSVTTQRFLNFYKESVEN